MTEIETIKNLVEKLNTASRAYYSGEEIMTNYEYDQLFDELIALENKTGLSLDNSPTRNVGAPVLDALAKSVHEYPALSLDKTKDPELFVRKLSESEMKARSTGSGCSGIVLMWKMDGSTVQLTYRNGTLVKAVTRGNGEVGSVITHNMGSIIGIPEKIGFHGELVVRGEAVMGYPEFERINSELPPNEQYANPRNLANATISMLDAKEASKRKIYFFAFDLVHLETLENTKIIKKDTAAAEFSGLSASPRSFYDQLELLRKMGFGTVSHEKHTPASLRSAMIRWEEQVSNFPFPVDGLVAAIDDSAYSASMPGTGHNPHISKGYAFKWKDDTVETFLREIEWSPGRTGVLTPVAIFDPVELEGTTVSRASLHNVSNLLHLDLKIGDRIEVFKANKIIPQVAVNLDKSDEWDGKLPSEESVTRNALPCVCPVCGGGISFHFTLTDGKQTDTLIVECMNPDCKAKLLGRMEHFVSRDGLNIEGLSTATLEKFISLGYIREFSDIFHLDAPENSEILDEITALDGFGKRSLQRLLDSIRKSRRTDFVSFINAIGIPNIGKGQAKLLKNYLLSEFRSLHPARETDKDSSSFFDALRILAEEQFDFTLIDGFGSVLAESLTSYLKKSAPLNGNTEITRLLREVSFSDEWPEENAYNSGEALRQSAISGKTFVITGKIEHFKNREELQNLIETLGGKLSSAVSRNTDYLINNDIESSSGKNQKAKEMGIPVITENEFLSMTSI